MELLFLQSNTPLEGMGNIGVIVTVADHKCVYQFCGGSVFNSETAWPFFNMSKH